jgi:hypothetical protein
MIAVHEQHHRSFNDIQNTDSQGQSSGTVAAFRTTARDYENPVDYEHPYPSMSQFADLLALRYDANRTRHAYYRQVRLIHQYFHSDPTLLTES